MKNKDKRSGFTPQENLVSILPSVAAGLIVFSAAIITYLVYFLPEQLLYKAILIIYGLGGILYLSSYYFIYTRSLNKSSFAWISAIIATISLCSLANFFPEEIDQLLYMLVLITALSLSLISSRAPAYFLVFSVTAFYFLIRFNQIVPGYEWVIHFSLTVAALMGVETIQQLKIWQGSRSTALRSSMILVDGSFPRWIPNKSSPCSVLHFKAHSMQIHITSASSKEINCIWNCLTMMVSILMTYE